MRFPFAILLQPKHFKTVTVCLRSLEVVHCQQGPNLAPSTFIDQLPGTACACRRAPGHGAPLQFTLVVKHPTLGRGWRQVPGTLRLQGSTAAWCPSLCFRVYPEDRSQIVKFWVGPKPKTHEFSLNFKVTHISRDVASVCGLSLGMRCHDTAPWYTTHACGIL